MEQIISLLPQAAELITKGGVVGVLLLVIGVLIYEIKRGRKQLHAKNNELASIYNQRDRALLMLMKVKTYAEAKGITVDLSDVRDMLPALPHEAAT